MESKWKTIVDVYADLGDFNHEVLAIYKRKMKDAQGSESFLIFTEVALLLLTVIMLSLRFWNSTSACALLSLLVFIPMNRATKTIKTCELVILAYHSKDSLQAREFLNYRHMDSNVHH